MASTIEIEAEEEILHLSSKKIKSILSDPEKSAKAVHLVYVHDSEPGIRRVKKGNQFHYYDERQVKINDNEILVRIKSLVLPPAWEQVWICKLTNGHLQATGVDAKNRKQYKYHALWNTLRNHTKYSRLHEFGKALPMIRERVEKDISLPGLPERKVLALVVSLMEQTNIRIGNNTYEKLYGSFGLTTLKDKHVHILGNELKFSFKGKKGVYHNISFKNKRLSKIVKACRDIPGKELFQYYTKDGDRRTIDSGMVNNYIREISGGEFTAKDFRTWSGTVAAFGAFKEKGNAATRTESKKKITEVLDIVSRHLGNTRNVCKKYYVHPAILSLYENSALDKYFQQPGNTQADKNSSLLTCEEQVILEILEQN